MSEYEGKYDPVAEMREIKSRHNPQHATSVHARFRLSEDTRVSGFSRQKKDGSGWEYVNGNRVKLYPVQGSPFGDATPSGELTMTIVNPDACKVFSEAEIGQEYDVIFTPVAKQE